MVADQPLELADRFRLAAEREVGLQPQLERGQAQPFQPAVSLRANASTSRSASGWAPPEPERLAEHARGLLAGALVEQPPPPSNRTLESLQVERVRVEPQPVTRRPRLDHILAEQLPQPRDVHLGGVDGGRRRPLVPELVDDPARRHDLVAAYEQDGQQRPLSATERELMAIPPDGKRTENAEFQASNLTLPIRMSRPRVPLPPGSA